MGISDLISFILYVAAVMAAIWFVRRVRNWRFLLLAGIGVLMCLRQALQMSADGQFQPTVFFDAAEDIPGLAAAILTLVAIVAFGRLSAAQANDRIRLEGILSAPSDLDWQVDAHGRFDYLSSRLPQIGDEEIAAMRGASAVQVDADTGAPPAGWAPLLEAVSRREPISDIVTDIVRPDGELLFLQHNAVPMLSPAGDFLGYRGSSRDVTRQVAAEEKSRAITDSAPIGIVGASLEGKVEFFNPAAEQIFGYRADEVLGKDVTLLYEEPLKSALAARLEAYRERGETALSGKGPFPAKGRRADGASVPVEIAFTSYTDDSGGHFIGAVMDVTARTAAEKSLTIAQSALESAQDAIMLMEVGGNLTWVNRSFLEMYGYDHPEEVIGMPAAALWAVPELTREPMEQLTAHGAWAGEAQGKRRDGGTFWSQATASAVRDEATGTVIAWMSSVRDVTEVRRAAEQLHDSEARLAEAQRMAHFGNWDWDLASGTLVWSDEVYRIFGLRKDAVVLTPEFGRSVVHPADMDIVSGAIARSRREPNVPYDVEHRIVRPDGEARVVHCLGEMTFNDTGEPVRFAATIQDITERAKVEDALRQSGVRLANAQRIAHLGNWDWHADTQEFVYSDEMYRIFGLRKGDVEMTLQSALSYIHPADVDRMRDAMARWAVNDPAAPPYAIEYRMIRPNGEVRVIHAEGEAAFDDTGKAVRISGTAQDITEQAKARAALARSEARTRLIMDSAAVGLVTINEAGLIESFNPEAERVFGYREAEVVGVNVSLLMPEPYHGAHDGYLEHYSRTRESHLLGQGPRELVGRGKDGKVFPIDLAVSQMTIDGRTTFIGSIQDISARKAAEDRLRQSQKMETVGQLTGGVAHDFNNILMAMQFNLELVKDRVAEDEDARDSVGAALRAVERGAELTGRLLAFSRKQPLQPKVVNVNALVGETMRLLHRALEESVDVETVLAAGVWSVNVDSGQFANALINLAVNARDAMPEGGKLTIETANTRISDDYARQHDDVKPGQYVMVAVSDAGTGMTPEVVERAFDPFFTTKEVGKGTGLGLSMVYGFVKQSGGHVNIYSEPGHGTTIKLYFPRTLAAGEKEERRAAAATAMSRGETILLVEDDPDVRLTVHRTLTALGYAVHAAANGPEALGLLDGGLRPELLLADVVLPLGMNGPAVARAVTERVPECRTLFMSGYTENAIVHHGRLDAGVVLLSKPFPREALAAKLREILDAPAMGHNANKGGITS